MSVGIIFFFIGWSNDPYVNTPVCTAANTQTHPRMVSDGANGAIIAWEDFRAGNKDIYAQRLDATGTALWTSDGRAVCTAADSQGNIAVASDGAGGIIMVWQDRRSGSQYDIYAQRVGTNGVVRWAAGGRVICTAANDQLNPQVVSDGSGGAIIVWQDNRGGNLDIYCRRIDSTGAVLWGAGGVAVCTAGSGQSVPQIVTDGLNGAIITWEDNRNGNPDVYAQRVSSNGTPQWTSNGIAVCTVDRGQTGPQIASTNNRGAIITWIDRRGTYYYSNRYYNYAQRITGNGAAAWAADGVYVNSEYAYEPESLQIVHDGANGAIISYTDRDCPVQIDVEMERLNASGHSVWRSEPTYTSGVYNGHLISDGSGGVLVTWMNDRYGTNSNIYAQRMNAGGQNEWGSYGLSVSLRPGRQEAPRIVDDGDGGAIICWHDGDIYAQRICFAGGLGDCVYPVAAMDNWRYGAILPDGISFDGSGSVDPDGDITQWQWDFGDGKTGYGERVTHTYTKVGTYRPTLKVQDNLGMWSAEAKAIIKIFNLNDLEATIESTTTKIKSDGKGMVQINASLYEKQTDPNHEERPIPGNLGIDFVTDAGSWHENLVFGNGLYSRTLVSAEAGTARVKAILKGKVMNTMNIEFTWPKPPVSIKTDLRVNRSLFRGEYFVTLSWSENPEEAFTPGKYRIYRSINGDSLQLVAEVDAGSLSYVDAKLPLGRQYAYAVSMVDLEGDESSLSGTVSANQ